MLKLDRSAFSNISNKAAWEAAGIKFPAYDREAMMRKTVQNPRWLHFGTGEGAVLRTLKSHLGDCA